jgi:hypothetical protein
MSFRKIGFFMVEIGSFWDAEDATTQITLNRELSRGVENTSGGLPADV